MDLYAFAAAPMSAGFRNRLRLAMILSGKAIGQEFGENDAGISCFPLSCAKGKSLSVFRMVLFMCISSHPFQFLCL